MRLFIVEIMEFIKAFLGAIIVPDELLKVNPAVRTQLIYTSLKSRGKHDVIITKLPKKRH